MVDIFHKHIRESLANENLQIALDANTERRFKARSDAFDPALADWQSLRERAHEVRQQTIANLDDYLDRFVNHAADNGMIVNQARDAEEATQLVLGIAKNKGARLIAKSKTMVSEEIELNRALEDAGVEVIETDLGEYIVQLRNERPAHIITPAVHLRKEDVGLTFQEKLGIPYSDDVEVMTAAARKQLRSTFLEADIGLSGVNFGVADSGTLCIVTNEGNGRMVSTIPPVHIALMGIERLVPNMDDLVVMLQLLTRSATGQSITVYTNLMNSPRRNADADGPDERHLILVDNGRSAMRDSPLAEALLCIRCGACLNACPVFGEIGGHSYVNIHGESSTYPGPIGSIVSPGLFGQGEFGHLARASSLCGACMEACPVQIDLPKLLLRVRAGGLETETGAAEPNVPRILGWGMRIYTWLATDAVRFKTALSLADFFSGVIAPRSQWLHLPVFTGWGYSKDLPRPAKRPFRERWEELQSSNQESTSNSDPGETGEIDPGNREINLPIQSKSMVQQFRDEHVTLGGTFTACEAEQLSLLVFEALKELNVSSIISWEKKQVPNNLIGALHDMGIEVSEGFNPKVKVGITGALAAVAETGTLVLTSGAGRPQFVSLTPEIHIVVLRASDIHHKLNQILKIREVRAASAVTLISGPSRTADIEMTLTIGVHGPRQVHIFCVEDM